jgi:hypothetical protein
VITFGILPPRVIDEARKEHQQMSENLIQSVSPHLTPPVVRERIQSSSETGSGADLSIMGFALGPITFADDDAE